MSSTIPRPSKLFDETNGKSQVKHQSSLLTTTGALLLVGQQFGSRCLTFVANQILLRYLSPEFLGISTQLDLYTITVLFFSRESLRITLQRQTQPRQHNQLIGKNVKGLVDARTPAGRTQAIVNLSYICLCIGIVAAFAFGWLYLHGLDIEDPVISGMPYFKLSLIIFGLASISELLAEPCYVVVQQRSEHYIRAASESTATLLRCLTTCTSAIYASQAGLEIGVLPFAFGQLIYSISLLAIYYWNVIQISLDGGFSLLPRPIYSPKNDGETFILSYFSRPLLTLSRSFFIQSLFKHALTQGDTFIISILAPPHAQGIYSLASNYGGLIARLILQPIEEISRNYFGKLLSDTSTYSQNLVSDANKSLIKLLRSYFILSIIIISVGPTAAPLLLKIIAGPKWSESEAGNVLATYCYYIPLLAINGLTEAFVSAVATEAEVHLQTVWMLAFSIIFSGVAFVFLKVWQLGAQGLVLANALNMIIRITWATVFIKSYLKRWEAKLDFGAVVPHPVSIAAGIAVTAALKQTEGFGDDYLLNIYIVGAISVGLFVFV